MFFQVAVKLIVMDAVHGHRIHCLGAGGVKPSVEDSDLNEGVTRPVILKICSLSSGEVLKILRWPEVTIYMASQGFPSEKKPLTFPEGSCEEDGGQPLELRRRRRREKWDPTKETRVHKGLTHRRGSSECGAMPYDQRACIPAPKGGGVMITRLFL